MQIEQEKKTHTLDPIQLIHSPRSNLDNSKILPTNRTKKYLGASSKKENLQQQYVISYNFDKTQGIGHCTHNILIGWDEQPKAIPKKNKEKLSKLPFKNKIYGNQTFQRESHEISAEMKKIMDCSKTNYRKGIYTPIINHQQSKALNNKMSQNKKSQSLSNHIPHLDKKYQNCGQPGKNFISSKDHLYPDYSKINRKDNNHDMFNIEKTKLKNFSSGESMVPLLKKPDSLSFKNGKTIGQNSKFMFPKQLETIERKKKNQGQNQDELNFESEEDGIQTMKLIKELEKFEKENKDEDNDDHSEFRISQQNWSNQQCKKELKSQNDKMRNKNGLNRIPKIENNKMRNRKSENKILSQTEREESLKKTEKQNINENGKNNRSNKKKQNQTLLKENQAHGKRSSLQNKKKDNGQKEEKQYIKSRFSESSQQEFKKQNSQKKFVPSSKSKFRSEGKKQDQNHRISVSVPKQITDKNKDRKISTQNKKVQNSNKKFQTSNKKNDNDFEKTQANIRRKSRMQDEKSQQKEENKVKKQRSQTRGQNSKSQLSNRKKQQVSNQQKRQKSSTKNEQTRPSYERSINNDKDWKNKEANKKLSTHGNERKISKDSRQSMRSNIKQANQNHQNEKKPQVNKDNKNVKKKISESAKKQQNTQRSNNKSNNEKKDNRIKKEQRQPERQKKQSKRQNKNNRKSQTSREVNKEKSPRSHDNKKMQSKEKQKMKNEKDQKTERKDKQKSSNQSEEFNLTSLNSENEDSIVSNQQKESQQERNNETKVLQNQNIFQELDESEGNKNSLDFQDKNKKAKTSREKREEKNSKQKNKEDSNDKANMTCGANLYPIQQQQLDIDDKINQTDFFGVHGKGKKKLDQKNLKQVVENRNNYERAPILTFIYGKSQHFLAKQKQFQPSQTKSPFEDFSIEFSSKLNCHDLVEKAIKIILSMSPWLLNRIFEPYLGIKGQCQMWLYCKGQWQPFSSFKLMNAIELLKYAIAEGAFKYYDECTDSLGIQEIMRMITGLRVMQLKNQKKLFKELNFNVSKGSVIKGISFNIKKPTFELLAVETTPSGQKVLQLTKDNEQEKKDPMWVKQGLFQNYFDYFLLVGHRQTSFWTEFEIKYKKHCRTVYIVESFTNVSGSLQLFSEKEAQCRIQFYRQMKPKMLKFVGKINQKTKMIRNVANPNPTTYFDFNVKGRYYIFIDCPVKSRLSVQSASRLNFDFLEFVENSNLKNDTSEYIEVNKKTNTSALKTTNISGETIKERFIDYLVGSQQVKKIK